jgi:hypothetical protein
MLESRIESAAVPDLNAITHQVLAAIYGADRLPRQLPETTDEWRTICRALAKMPVDVVIELCRLKGSFAIARILMRVP